MPSSGVPADRTVFLLGTAKIRADKLAVDEGDALKPRLHEGRLREVHTLKDHIAQLRECQ
jgi:hypothetical protein